MMAAELEIAPGVDGPRVDPAVLDALLRGWLLGYRSTATRLAYGDALGLHRPWVRELSGEAVPPAGRRPPVRLGRYRDLAWFRWCDRQGLHPFAATSTEVKRWQAELAAAGMPKSTRAHRLAAVGEFYRHLVGQGVLGANPAAFDRRGLGLGTAGDTSRTVVLTVEQVDALAAAASRARRGVSPLMGLRAQAVVALFTLGLRVGELAALRRGDLHVTRGRRALRVTGKGDKARVVYLSRTAERVLEDYLAERDRCAGAAVPARVGRVSAHDAPLVATGRGTHLNPRDVWAMLRRLARAAGPELADVTDRMTPHALRHFYVTAAAELGADMTHVQADVGHASVDTTNRVYNRAARHPDRSAVDVVDRALVAARARRAAAGPAVGALEEVRGRLRDAEPLTRLAAVQRLEHLVADHPDLVARAVEVLDAVVAGEDQPVVAEAARLARDRLAG
ncbi:integrase [Saccharothrix syringae]|uniref:Integrase n=2 Tax=Saccharothrix syringae TaxID=103733 RepID=A0A5Q0H1M7_SACSY|nr:integrase [Saccharothrix syringae]